MNRYLLVLLAVAALLVPGKALAAANAVGNGSAATVQLSPPTAQSGNITITGGLQASSIIDTTLSGSSGQCVTISSGGQLNAAGAACPNATYVNGTAVAPITVVGLTTNASFTCSAGSICSVGTVTLTGFNYITAVNCVLTPVGSTTAEGSIMPIVYSLSTSSLSIYAYALAAVSSSTVQVNETCIGY